MLRSFKDSPLERTCRIYNCAHKSPAPPASMVKFLLQPYCSVLGKTAVLSHFFFFFACSLFFKPQQLRCACGEFPLLGTRLSFLCDAVTLNCFCTLSAFDPLQLAASRRNHIYGDPNSALSCTSENLRHYTIGLERLKKSCESRFTGSCSVNVRQGYCFCASTFYFKAVPELQSMILFHNIEVEGEIWSMRCAVLSVEFAIQTDLARRGSNVCAVRSMFSVGFWFLSAFKPLVTV